MTLTRLLGKQWNILIDKWKEEIFEDPMFEAQNFLREKKTVLMLVKVRKTKPLRNPGSELVIGE